MERKREVIIAGMAEKNNNSNFPQGFLMKSLINSDFVSIIMLTYTGLDKTYDLAHYTKRAPAFGIIRSTKIHSYTERSARSYDNPKCKK
jgi:ubiquinone biosynthesis protein COQ9